MAAGLATTGVLPVDLGPEDLTPRTWSFGLQDAPPSSPYVQLFPDGSTAGFPEADHWTWRLEGGRLQLLDRYDCAAVLFRQASVEPQGQLRLLGASPDEPTQLYEFSERSPEGGLLQIAPDLPFRSRCGPRRRNLVVLRADERSVHRDWPKNISDDDRSWDLCISFYGRPENFGLDPWAEHQVLQREQRQFGAIHQLFYKDSPFWNYDYVAFPDDDVLMSWRDLNELFAVCRRYRLALAQPALTPDSFITHPITVQNPDYLVRYVTFVEVMTPIFSKDALKICMPSFKSAVLGYGLDHIWRKLLGEPPGAMAVIDQVPVLHTRPVGGLYSTEAASDEGWNLQVLYDAHLRILELGGIRRTPSDMRPAHWPR